MPSYSDSIDAASFSSSDTFDYPKPLFVYKDKLDDDQTILEWAKKARDSAVKAAKKRQDDTLTNQALYKGDVKKTGGAVSRMTDVPDVGNTSPETQYIVVNFLHNLTEARVARFSRYRDNLEVLPANAGEAEDKESARLVKELISYLRYVTDFKHILTTLGRRMMISAEAYMFVEWDPEQGNVLPEVSEALKTTGEAPLIETPEGSMPLPEDQWNMGEISFRVPYTTNVFLEPVVDGDFKKVGWAIERQLFHVEQLKLDHPDKAHQIKEDAFSTEDAQMLASQFDQEWDGKAPKGFVWCYYLWHKKTKHLPEGRLLVFTNSCMLSNDKHPYDHKQLPFKRITDIDVDGELYPKALFTMNRNLNGIINNLYSMMYRYQVLMGQAKWVIPDAAGVETQALGNDHVGMKYRGAVAPSIVSAPPLSGELFAQVQELKEQLSQQMVVFPMAQGQVPPNIRAGVSMLFMDEQENERFDAEAKKHNQFVVEIWRLALAVVRQFYSKDEERKLAVFGSEESYTIEEFDPTILNTPFNIRLQNSPALPESKAARTQYLLDIDERKPLPPAAFYQALDLGIPEAYINDVTKSKKSADSENSQTYKNLEIAGPQSFEDHIAHLEQHYMALQDKAFKGLDELARQSFLEHVRMHEFFLMSTTYLDFDMTRPIHPTRAQLLAEMPLFPSVFTPNIDRLQLQASLETQQMEMAAGAMGMAADPMGAAPMNVAGPQAAPMEQSTSNPAFDSAGLDPSSGTEPGSF